MKENWVIPCNVKYFDVLEHFSRSSTVVWKKAKNGISVGDNAFIYVGAPYSAILYRCEVVDSNVPKDIVEANSYAIQKEGLDGIDYMLLELKEELPKDRLSLQVLKKNGLGQVQTQARADRRLVRYLNRICKTPLIEKVMNHG